MTGSATADVTRLVHDYDAFRAVDDITFDIRRGEVLGLLGPNGAGKSTTMRIVAGTMAATEGRVLICGYDLAEQPLEARSRIGYLPEIPPLYRDLRVNEFLDYCARLHRIPADRLAKAIDSAKTRCGLETTGNRIIGRLSKGYQQRVGIAQAIIHNPALVILDEPTVGLDPVQILEIRELIRTLGNDHSVILSTHILAEVQAVCDRVLIMNHGKLVLDKSMEELDSSQPPETTRVALACPPPIEVLEKIPEVSRVEQLDAQHFVVRHGAGAFDAQQLAKDAAMNGWGLYEMTPDRSTLEDIFVQLTCHDLPVPQSSEELAGL
jgi:ABC-2 type transport system ATP-binding protein